MFQSKKTADSDSLSNEDLKFLDDYSWMIRPCNVYITEFKHCTSIKGRFDQYYSEGKIADCSRWNNDRYDCRKYTKEENLAAGIRVIQNERKRVEERLKTFRDNDVMKERKIRPPANWNSPLPRHIEERQTAGYLADHLDELAEPFEVKRSFCVIS